MKSHVELMMDFQLALLRREHLRTYPDLTPEAVFTFIMSAAGTASHALSIIKQMEHLDHDDPVKQDCVSGIAYLLRQIEEHHVNTFGVPAAWLNPSSAKSESKEG